MSIPAHMRIRSDLLKAIESGALAGAQRLPGESELAHKYGVTRMTVRQALSGLVNDGLVVRRRGVGTFVARNAAQRRNMSRLTGFTEDMRSEGRQVETCLLTQRIEPPDQDLADLLELGDGAFVIFIERVRSVDGAPVILQRSWIPSHRCPDLWRDELVDGSLYATLRTRYEIDLRRADQRFAAVTATADLAQQLEVAEGVPLLRVERLTFDPANEPVEFARSWTRPGFEIGTHIER